MTTDRPLPGRRSPWMCKAVSAIREPGQLQPLAPRFWPPTIRARACRSCTCTYRRLDGAVLHTCMVAASAIELIWRLSVTELAWPGPIRPAGERCAVGWLLAGPPRIHKLLDGRYGRPWTRCFEHQGVCRTRATSKRCAAGERDGRVPNFRNVGDPLGDGAFD